MTEPEILPNFRTVRLDQTSHWNKDIVNQLNGGKIYAVYLYDKNQVTHCCELTPSYCLHWIRDEGEMGDGSAVSDELDEEITSVGTDTPVEYIHCRILDLLPEDRFHDIAYDEAYDPEKHDSREEWYKDELELALDYARCNS